MTEQIEAIAKRLVVRHKRDGRSVYDARAKSELIGVARQSGVSLAKIARMCGINANVLSNWMRQHERANAVPPAARGEVVEMAAAAFVPVQLEPARPEPVMTSLNVQARLPNGVVLDLGGCDLEQAGKLIEALGRMRCSASTKG